MPLVHPAYIFFLHRTTSTFQPTIPHSLLCMNANNISSIRLLPLASTHLAYDYHLLYRHSCIDTVRIVQIAPLIGSLKLTSSMLKSTPTGCIWEKEESFFRDRSLIHYNDIRASDTASLRIVNTNL